MRPLYFNFPYNIVDVEVSTSSMLPCTASRQTLQQTQFLAEFNSPIFFCNAKSNSQIIALTLARW